MWGVRLPAVGLEAENGGYGVGLDGKYGVCDSGGLDGRKVVDIQYSCITKTFFLLLFTQLKVCCIHHLIITYIFV